MSSLLIFQGKIYYLKTLLFYSFGKVTYAKMQKFGPLLLTPLVFPSLPSSLLKGIYHYEFLV